MNEIKAFETPIPLSQAAWPLPFSQRLEFSSPARGTWNIVHTGMLIPQSHEIFVCAKGCLRGVVLTAAEMGEMGRYSALEIKEEQVLNGNMESMMIEGVSDILEKLPVKPKAVLLFISCHHFFLAYDQQYVFDELRRLYPDIDFTDCYMIPTLRKSGITPDQKMRMQMYSLLKPRKKNPRQINVMGSNLGILRTSEIYELAGQMGFQVTSLNDCETYEDYQRLAEGSLNLIIEPIALMGAMDMEKRLGIPYLYLPNVFRTDQIRNNLELLRTRLAEYSDVQPEIPPVESMVQAVRTLIGDCAIAIDYTFTFRLLNLTRFLVENGFQVTDLYVDVFLPEENEDFLWLKEHAPDIRLWPTSGPQMRFVHTNGTKDKVLALGQKAACFAGTDYFVNIAEGGGWFGFDAVRRLMQEMAEAFQTPKNREAVVTRKGYGRRSLLDEVSESGYASNLKAATNPDRPSDRSEASNPDKTSNRSGAPDLCCCHQTLEKLKESGNLSSAVFTPTYSSDEFGICSALYELGGMTVIHDASGCNSTYTTHDEPRWYGTDSMFYISAISEMEAIMGDDEKLISDILDAAQRLKPEFIAVVGAPIPYMTGTDLKAIARILEAELAIPCFGFPANGMDDYQRGISMATLELAKRICGERTVSDAAGRKPVVNVLGATPLDFALNGSMASICEWLLKNGMQPGCTFSMDSNIGAIRTAQNADVNLVVTAAGMEAARYMKHKFGIPFVTGVPYGNRQAEELAKKVFTACQEKSTELSGFEDSENEGKHGETVAAGENSGKHTEGFADSENIGKHTEADSANVSEIPVNRNRKQAEPKKIVLIREAVTGTSLAEAIEAETGSPVTLICPVEHDPSILRKGDYAAQTEDEVIRVIREVQPQIIIADPFYQVLAPLGTDFYPLPHEAFSGRIYDKQNPNMIGERFNTILEKWKLSE